MNALSAVLAPSTPGQPVATTAGHSMQQQQQQQRTFSQNNNEGYTALADQGSSSCSSSTASSSSSSLESAEPGHHHRLSLSFPVEVSSSSSQENVSTAVAVGAASSRDSFASGTDKTDRSRSNKRGFATTSPAIGLSSSSSSEANSTSTASLSLSSSLDLSNPNIAGQYSSGDFHGHEDYLYAVQSLEHDLDCILENRDLNPFYEDMVALGVAEKNQEIERVSEADSEFNVEDYLVDLDQYLDEQDEGAASSVEGDQRLKTGGSGTLNRRILRRPNTNRTLPRNLREKEDASRLNSNSSVRNSLHLGKQANGK